MMGSLQKGKQKHKKYDLKKHFSNIVRQLDLVLTEMKNEDKGEY